MVTPGLLPEADRPRRSPLPWILLLLGLAFAGLLAALVVLMLRLRDERDRAVAKADGLIAQLRKPAPAPVAQAPAGEAPPEGSQDRVRRGREELKAGRVDSAEAQFLRAGPAGHAYLVLTSLARDDVKEAMEHVGRAFVIEPFWFRGVAPRELLVSGEEADRIAAALDVRVRADPLDARSKVLLAFVVYHEKGAAYAKALLVEALNADPGNVEATLFLKNLDQ